MRNSYFSLGVTLVLFISCERKIEPTLGLISTKNDPPLERYLDSLKIDSTKYKSRIDSLFLFDTSNQKLAEFLNQCYWPNHVRRIVIPPEKNPNKGFSTAEADKKVEWLFEKKTFNCNDFYNVLLEINGVKALDSASSFSLFLEVDPFGHPLTFVTLDKEGELAFTESYARDGLLGYPRQKLSYRFSRSEINEVSVILGVLTAVPKENNNSGLDGTSISLRWCLERKCYEVYRWCDPQELKDLWQYFETKLKVRLPKC